MSDPAPPSSGAPPESSHGSAALGGSFTGVPGDDPDLSRNAGGARLEPGARVGDFVLGRQLGAGGMGLVFEAHPAASPSRKVALKIMRSVVASRATVARFRREIASIRRLDHPAIVPVLAAGVHEGLPYYVMESVVGISLARLLEQLRHAGGVPTGVEPVGKLVADPAGDRTGRPPWASSYGRWAARVGLELAEALAHAHSRGVIHRDIKPGNVIITPGGSPVLVDFGLAAHEAADTITRSGDFLGTLAYAPPEQIRGEAVDGRADVYSLGATLYELLCLRRPHESPHRDALLRQIETQPPAALGRGVPRALRTICRVALAPRRARRYPSASALAADLRAQLAGDSISARSPGPWVHVVAAVRRHPVPSLMLALVLTGVVAVLGWDLARVRRLGAQSRDLARRATELAVEIDRTRGRLVALFDDSGLRVRRGRDVPAADALRTRLESLHREHDGLLDQARDRLLGASELLPGLNGVRAGLADLLALRLQRGLVDLQDVFEAPAMHALAHELATLDVAREHAALLDPLGDVRVASEPSGARAVVRRTSDRSVVLDAVTPLSAELPLGSYVASLEAPGAEPCVVPLLVRHRSAPLPPGCTSPPWSDLMVELLPAGALSERWVHVPGGWSVVGRDPPLWRHVDSVLVMRREVTYADWLSFLNDQRGGVPGPDAEDFTKHPRWANDLGQLHTRHTPAGWVVRPEHVHDVTWPVRNVTHDDMRAYQQYLLRKGDDLLADHFLDLPSELEWERMTRGADGRPYPWGWEFDWNRCISFYGRPDPDAEPWPAPVESVPTDVSVFGVVDLAGSVSEMTRDPHGTGVAYYAVRGGSYNQRDRRAYLTTSRRGQDNSVSPDIGFRLVQRRLPAWLSAPRRPIAQLVDEFDRPDSEDAGPGWVELTHGPLHAPGDPSEGERIRVESGRLHIAGGAGNFSNRALALRAVDLQGSAFRMRVVLGFSATHPGEPGVGERGVQIGVRDERGQQLSDLGLSLGGRLHLRHHVGGTDVTRRPRDALDLGAGFVETEFVLELTGLHDRLQGRAWPVGEARPAEPQLELPGPCATPVHFVGVEVDNLAGVQARVDRFALETLPAACEQDNPER